MDRSVLLFSYDESLTVLAPPAGAVGENRAATLSVTEQPERNR